MQKYFMADNAKQYKAALLGHSKSGYFPVVMTVVLIVIWCFG